MLLLKRKRSCIIHMDPLLQSNYLPPVNNDSMAVALTINQQHALNFREVSLTDPQTKDIRTPTTKRVKRESTTPVADSSHKAVTRNAQTIDTFHMPSFLQMEKNMYTQMQFVMLTDKRVQHHKQQLLKCQAMCNIPLDGKLSNIRVRQHAAIIQAREQEALRVIEEGIEQDVYLSRQKQFWETWNQLPIEKRSNEDQMLNFYSQFFQPGQTIPDITTHKICPTCNCTLYNSKRESDWDCKSCGMYQTYITPRTTVRIAYSKTNTTTMTAKSREWKTFINMLVQFVDGETPVTTQLKQEIVDQHCFFQHNRPLTNPSIKPTVINRILKDLNKKDLCEWTPRILMELLNKGHPHLMQPHEYDKISARFKYVQKIHDMFHHKHGFELCDPKYAFKQICLILGWLHLLPLFPIQDNDNDQLKWTTLIDFVAVRDTVTVWKIPSV